MSTSTTISTTTFISPSTALPLNSALYNGLPTSHTDDHRPTRPCSSLESQTVVPRSPNPGEVEDEASNGAATEAVKSTDSQYISQTFPEEIDVSTASHYEQHLPSHPAVSHNSSPMVLNTAATPMACPAMTPKSVVEQSFPKTPIQRRPLMASRDPSIKLAMTSFFRRSHSQILSSDATPTVLGSNAIANRGSDPVLRKVRRLSKSRISAHTSPSTTRSNTPPSPASPTIPVEGPTHLTVQEPPRDQFLGHGKTQRSSTGFNLRGKLSMRPKNGFVSTGPASQYKQPQYRTSSVDLDRPVSEENSQAELPPRQIWGMAANMGVGLKSRRLSLSLPDNFTVEVIELYSEYSDQSKLVGRRGRMVGKGATAQVRLMNRKGVHAGQVYAVKEFRGKSSNEKAEEYEKKVKSEYTIAKSAHHPNIVESYSLCTHNGRWNHVMEFCDQGDLFHLVSQKYLSKSDRLKDRLCLFKQLIQGLNYLHCNGISHRDIKLENLLVTKNSRLKITDFGVSEVFSGIHPGLRAADGKCGKGMGQIRLCAPGMCGSPPYVAPEVVEKKSEYDPRPLDVWGAAVVMLCMCANGCLWQEAKAGNSAVYDDLVGGWSKWNTKHEDHTDAGITEMDYPHVSFFDQHINPPALRRVLLTMLNPDPNKRFSIQAVAKNRWLKNIECCQIDSYDEPTMTIDASNLRSCAKNLSKIVLHNHLPPPTHFKHRLVRLSGSTDM